MLETGDFQNKTTEGAGRCSAPLSGETAGNRGIRGRALVLAGTVEARGEQRQKEGYKGTKDRGGGGGGWVRRPDGEGGGKNRRKKKNSNGQNAEGI